MQSISEQIKAKRARLGLSQKDLALALNLNESGERTVRGWELGEHKPTPKKLAELLALNESFPFKDKGKDPSFKFIDLFAGIGGIRLAYQEQAGKCVFSSEWDKFAQRTYLANFGEMPHGDITKISAKDIPDHDVLLGGFPCQAFSQAGKKQGFNDTRGTMFFEIQRILVEKRPKAFMLENVKQLKGHDKGNTLKTIINILTGNHSEGIDNSIELSDETRAALSAKLNYWADIKVLNARDFGSPQNRERIFIVGFDKDYFKNVEFDFLFKWPEPKNRNTRVGDILEDLSSLPPDQDKYTISDKLWNGHQRRKTEHAEKGNGFGYCLFDENSTHTNTISARYYKDGSEILIDQSKQGKNPRKLTERECARLQGFPERFIVDAVSQGQIYKQFGNSVCINVVREIAKELTKCLKKAENLKNNK